MQSKNNLGKGTILRVIEPADIKRRSIKKKKRPIKRTLFIVGVVLVIGASLWFKVRPVKISANLQKDFGLGTKAVKGATVTADPPKKGTFKQFTNTEFVAF